jgi:hypothetical protein
MLVLPLLLLWGSYTGAMYGWCLLRGYDVSLTQLVNPLRAPDWPAAKGPAGSWPPAQAGNLVIFPDGTTASEASAATSATSSGTVTATGRLLGNSPGGGTAAQNQATAKSVIKANGKTFAGWDIGSQWSCLVKLWSQESGWSATAANPSSGAFGIAQSLHGNVGGLGGNEYNAAAPFGLTAAQLKAANNGNAAAQILWGLNYVLTTYGSPCAAWAHEQSQGWY